MIEFQKTSSVEIALTSDIQAAVDQITDAANINGYATNTHLGFQALRTLVATSTRPDAQRVCVLISDGSSNDFESALEEVQDANVFILEPP